MTDSTAPTALPPKPFAGQNRRKSTPIKSSTHYAYLTSLGLSTAHYVEKCLIDGHWHWLKPEDALLENWITLLLPVFGTIGLIWSIFQRRLMKLAGEPDDENPGCDS